MESVSFKFETFEGPLDLLLHLLSKHKIDIYDIPIAIILEQYMGYLDNLKHFDMEITAEFLSMASQLVYIKSKMLLPKHEEDGEEVDPREELVQKLIEYQKYKGIIGDFENLYEEGSKYYVKTFEYIKFDPLYKKNHNINELTTAYNNALVRNNKALPPKITSFKEIVSRKIASVSSKVILILKNAIKKEKFNFKSMFKKGDSKSDVVASFLACLELIKTGRIKVTPKGNNDYNIKICKNKDKSDE